MRPEDIEPGRSYACEYTRTLIVDSVGNPASTLASDAHTVVRTGTAIIERRDTEQRLLLVRDIDTEEQFVLDYADAHNIDIIEWTDNESTT